MSTELAGDGRAFYHVGIVVDSLDDAMDGLSRALGIAWRGTQVSNVGAWAVRIAYSLQGPPYVELIEAVAGSPWIHAPEETVHHLAYWSSQPDLDRERLEMAGMPLETDGREYGLTFSYHRSPQGGLRIELQDAAVRDAWLARWKMEPRS